MQHRGDLNKTFQSRLYPPRCSSKHFFFSPGESKGSALWVIFLVYRNTWPDPTQEHWTKPLHLKSLLFCVRCNEITSRNNRGETPQLHQITKTRPAGSKVTKMNLLEWCWHQTVPASSAILQIIFEIDDCISLADKVVPIWAYFGIAIFAKSGWHGIVNNQGGMTLRNGTSHLTNFNQASLEPAGVTS